MRRGRWRAAYPDLRRVRPEDVLNASPAHLDLYPGGASEVLPQDAFDRFYPLLGTLIEELNGDDVARRRAQTRSAEPSLQGRVHMRDFVSSFHGDLDPIQVAVVGGHARTVCCEAGPEHGAQPEPCVAGDTALHRSGHARTPA